MPLLRIRLLGPFQVWLNDQLISPQDWLTQKTKDLLKILVTERGHVVPFDRLKDLLWPDLTPASAANSLRVGISRLRHLLEPARARGVNPSYVLTVGPGYIFQATPDVWIDVDNFVSAVSKGQVAEQRAAWGLAIAAYQAAKELYRGDYLEENLYDDWAMAPREQLWTIHLDMLSRLAHCYAQQGHYRRALGACQEVLVVDSLRESVYRQLMLYHYQLGQRDQALRAYERCRAALTEELGVDPLPDTQELYTCILREERLDQPVLTPEFLPSPPVQPMQRASLACLPFVGRDPEMAALDQALQGAHQGQPHMVVVEGEVGVGKSRLCEEFLAYAADQGAQTFQGRAFELERDLPFRPLREALSRHLLQGSSPDTARRVLGPWASHLALLLPELRQIIPGIPFLSSAICEDERQWLIDGLTQFCLALAAIRPTVFFVDDLQWTDPGTLTFLYHLICNSGQAPVLVLGASCTETAHSNHALHVVASSLARKGLAAHVYVERLSAQAVAHLVVARAAPSWDCSAFSLRLYQETEGNPLFLAELLRSLFEAKLLVEDDAARWRPGDGDPGLTTGSLPLPATVHEVIAARCAEVGDAGQQVLRAAAVTGRAFSVGLLQRVLPLSADQLLDALDDLVARHLIEELMGVGEVGYRFTHDKIREVVCSDLSAARRQYLQVRIAAALEDAPMTLPPKAISDCAHQDSRARNDKRAIECW